jgi:hypothetical protein
MTRMLRLSLKFSIETTMDKTSGQCEADSQIWCVDEYGSSLEFASVGSSRTKMKSETLSLFRVERRRSKLGEAMCPELEGFHSLDTSLTFFQ